MMNNKLTFKLTTAFLFFSMILLSYSCYMSSRSAMCPAYGDGGGRSFRKASPMSSSSSSTSSAATKTTTKTTIKAGSLTAGEIHDFSKWELWTGITGDQLKEWQSYWEIAPTNRYAVQLVNEEGGPVIDQSVELINESGDVIWTARTDNTGKAELWSNLFETKNKLEGLKVKMTFEGAEQTQAVETFPNGVNTIQLKTTCTAPEKVDIMFVVDATGSMGDEIAYLKVELNDIISKVKKSHKDLDVNLGSVFYRDKTDAYLTRKTPLSNDISKTIDFIAKQQAGGGGDFPEAVDAGLDVAINKIEWSKGARARLLFLVLDAPPHADAATKKKLNKITADAAKKGIRIIPLTASGIDKKTEYLMRSMALATNGTYVFLTNHSGIGGHHIEPTTDSYDVELLNDLLLRLVDQYTYVPSCEQQVALVQEEVKDTLVIVNPDRTTVIDVAVNEASTEPVLTAQADTDSLAISAVITDTEEKLQPIQPKLKKLKYYPNPTNGPITIEISGKTDAVYLADISGKLLKKFEASDQHRMQINISEFPSGIYFLRCLHKEKWLSGKVILMR
jgi:hypothetical protein